MISSVIGIIVTLSSTWYYLQIFEPSDFGELAGEYLVLSFAIVLSDMGLNGALTRRNDEHIEFDPFQSLLSLMALVIVSVYIIVNLLLGDFCWISSAVILLSMLTNISALKSKTTLTIKEKYHTISRINIIALVISHIVTIIIVEIYAEIEFLFLQKLWYYTAFSLLLAKYARVPYLWRLKLGGLKLYELRIGASLTLSQLTESAYKQSLPVIIATIDKTQAGLFLQGMKLVDIGNNIIGSVYNTIVFSLRIKSFFKTDEITKYISSGIFVMILCVYSIMYAKGEIIIANVFGTDWIGVRNVILYSLAMSLVYSVDMSIRSLVKAEGSPTQIVSYDVPKKMLLLASYGLAFFVSFKLLFLIAATSYATYIFYWCYSAKMDLRIRWKPHLLLSLVFSVILILLV